MSEHNDTKALEESKGRIRKGSKKYAQKAGYKLNPDSGIVETIVTGLANNRLRHGRAYCPCMFVSGDLDEDKKIICPCHVHRVDIEKKGKCHCGLFVKDG
jgi:ferredoxin-thioredoxin reductase catalytic subunit